MALIDIIKTEDVKEIKKLFARPSFSYEQDKAINEYKVEKHSVLDTSVRKNKVIQNGAGTNNTDGSEKTTETSVPVARIGLSYQKLIVKRRVGFMLTVPVSLDPIYNSESDKEKDLVKMVKRIQNDNKIDYLNKEIARRLMSEMEVAEIWYLVESGLNKPKFTLKCDIWSKDLGDTLYPYFDAYGNMIAFAREYKLKEGDKDIEHFDIYLDVFEYKFVNRNSTWILDDTLTTAEGVKIPNPKINEVGKIMIVYHSQQYPEWADQQTAIDRLETSYSNHADMNDYFGSPILSLIGELFGGGLVKGDQGKIIQMEKDAKAGFLELNSKPESVKMEQENLHNAIMNLSQTPDISFNAMQGLGALSGIALKLMFLDAHLAVGEKEEIFGIGLQRRINIIKAAIGKVIDTSLAKEAETVQIIPKITPYIPLNETELIDNISVSVTSETLSKETGAEINPLSPDSKLEIKRLKKEKQGEKAEID